MAFAGLLCRGILIDIKTTKKANSSIERKIDALTDIVSKGFAAVADDIADIKTDIIYIKTDIVGVKGDLSGLQGDLSSLRNEFNGFREETRENFRSLKSEIADIRTRLEHLETLVRNHSGFSKEIDFALSRISAIEKHLGLNQKIAA